MTFAPHITDHGIAREYRADGLADTAELIRRMARIEANQIAAEEAGNYTESDFWADRYDAVLALLVERERTELHSVRA